jgi:membrane-associated phospholipid phosphatase
MSASPTIRIAKVGLRVPRLGADTMPIFLLFAAGVVTYAWNASAHLVWSPGLEVTGVIPLTLLMISWALKYAPRMPQTALVRSRIAEVFFYFSLWAILAVVGTRLSYLMASLRMPLQDALLHRIDAMLGLDWHVWYEYSVSHPVLNSLQHLAYNSYSWQWILSVLFFSSTGRTKRNRELITALIITVLLVISVSGILPALGPNEIYGIQSPWHDIMVTIRSGIHAPLHHMGIVTFPSLHTSFAVLYVYAHRNIKWTYLPVLILNIVMLISIPVCGYHYFTDMLGGVFLAVVAIILTHAVFINRDAV